MPELQGQIEAASEAVSRERQRADELQMEQDQAAAQSNQVQNENGNREGGVGGMVIVVARVARCRAVADEG